MSKNYWLLKSEPDVWSIEQQKKAGTKGAAWDGVRNYQAAKNLKAMKKGDQCFFYHSNIGKEIVGVVEVTKEAYLDKTDQSGRFVAVTVKFIRKLERPITSSRLQELLIKLVGNQNPLGNAKSSANKSTLSQNINTNDKIIIENDSNKSN